MTVTSVRKLYESEGGESTLTIQQNSVKIVRTYAEVYRVEVSTNTDGPYTVGSAAGLPLLGSPFYDDTSATCRKIAPKREAGNKLTWLVQCDYSTETPDPSEEEENPLLKPVIRNKRSNRVEIPMTEDLDGNAVLNKAGCQPTTPVMVSRSWGIYQFTKNYSTFNDAFADAIEDSINSQPFLGKDAGTVRCNSIEAEEVYEGDFHYWKLSFEFEYNPLGWQPRVLNDGLHQLSGGNLERILDDNGEPVSEPVPLDVNGARIDPASLPGAAVYLDFVGYEEYDFNQLNLN